MFFKSEKKKSAAPVFMAVGALAAVGVWSIYKRGQDMVCKMMKKRTCECDN